MIISITITIIMVLVLVWRGEEGEGGGVYPERERGETKFNRKKKDQRSGFFFRSSSYNDAMNEITKTNKTTDKNEKR